MPIHSSSRSACHKQAGFTLIELIVTLVVLALVGTIGALSLSQTKATLFTATSAVSELTEVSHCLETLSAEFDALRVEKTDNGAATTAFLNKYKDTAADACKQEGLQVSLSQRNPKSFGEQLEEGTVLLLTIQKNTARLDYVLGD
ncbi:MAG: prepilin-type N-terminal cleavage/methylation domain-containing protein [Desulfovibrionaceae bacterium]|nr:prepilin-type N-terminal cleavage/methylation domain-containing protein [Desulfovibrionaceae bacterium]